MNIDLIDKEFKNYVNTFDMSDKNIYLKYEHTFEVVNIITEISKKMNLSEDDIFLAKTIAYLHDIGRFEQVKKTKTFKDNEMDHADNGVDLLFKRGLIEKFNIDKKYYSIIEKAIRNHNKLEIKDDLEKDEELFVKLIRDADKIDIYRVRVKYLENKFLEVPQKINLDSFYNHESINIKNNKNKSDAILCVLSFIYDLNYKESIEVLKETGYYQKFIANIEIGQEQKDLFKEIKNEVYRYLKIEE